MQPPPASPLLVPVPPKKNRAALWVAIAVVALVVVIAVVLVAASQAPASKPAPTATTLYSAGSTLSIPNHTLKGLSFNLNAAATLSGSFVASSPVTLYVLNPQDYTNLTSTGIPGSYLWTSGTNVTAASISSNFAVGSYYFVVVNLGPTGCTFTFSTNFEATPY